MGMIGCMQKGGNIRCKLKGGIDKGGHYDMGMIGCMQKGALSGAN